MARVFLCAVLALASSARAFEVQALPDQTLFYDFAASTRQVGFFSIAPHPTTGTLRRTRLSYSPIGGTNIVTIQIDGVTHVFGYRPSARTEQISYGSVFRGQPVAAATDALGWTRQLHLVTPTAAFPVGHRCVWKPHPDIEVGQTVRLARGKSRKIDVAFLEYDVTNVGTRDHSVGVRVLYDLAVSENDSPVVRFPPRPDIHFLRPVDLTGAEVPPVLEAYMVADQTYVNNTTLLMGFEGRAAWPRPDRLSITRKPQGVPAIERWDIALAPPLDDSVLIAYWNAQALRAATGAQPGERRVVGLTLGLSDPPRE